MTEPLDSRRAKLELNSQQYQYDAHLERAANLIDTDMTAWLQLSPIVRDRSSMYHDARNAYRAALEAGAIPPDPGTVVN